jgi:alpha-glucosidase
LDDVYWHWQKLYLNKPSNGQFTLIFPKLDDICRHFEQLDYTRKLLYKARLHDFASPKITSMCPTPEKIITKGLVSKVALKKEKMTKRDPSFWEHVDTAIPNTQSPHSSSKCVPKPHRVTRPKKLLPYIYQFPPELHEYIENIVNVKSDGNYGYQLITSCIGLEEDSWPLVHNQLVKEMVANLQLYTAVFRSEQRLE